MDTSAHSQFSRQLNVPVSGAPPLYGNHNYEPLREEAMEFQNNHGIQSTIVNINSERPVRDHLLWSIFNLIYMNFCCLGLLALVFSVKSRDRKVLADRSGALSYGSTSRSLNIAATTLCILMIVIMIILVATGVIVLANMSHVYNDDFYGK